MSGLNDNVTSSGDVFLNGDPNAFTGTNTFNVNRPTSTITTTPNSTDFITKQNADALYSGAGAGDVFLNGNPNAFTGTNTFNNNRPTSTLTGGTTNLNDFITKRDGDVLYAAISVNGDVTKAGTNAFTGTNTFNNNRPTSTLTGGTTDSDDFITKRDGDVLYAAISVDGDVTKAGTNAFTGTNTFNSNLPTSSITPSNANDLVTKSYVDSAFVTEAGNNAFTGTNTFNSNLPTSSITPSNANDLVTKSYVDSVGGDVTEAGNNAFTGTNTFNVNRPTSTISSTPGSNDFITKQNADALYGSSAFLPKSGGTLDGDLTIGDNEDQYILKCDKFNAVSGNMTLETSLHTGGINILTSGNVEIDNLLMVNHSGNTNASLYVGAPSSNSQVTRNQNRHFRYDSGTSLGSGGTGTFSQAVGIFSEDRIISASYVQSINGSISSSDKRIKENEEEFKDNEATDLLKQLKPKKYNYINRVGRGDDIHYGFIAQDVEEVLPVCVHKTGQFEIPNIYKLCDVSNDVITIDDVTDLSLNDNLRLYDASDNKINVKITDISNNSVKIDKSIEDDKTFVFGKEINDFHSLHHEQIWAISSAAVIELIKRVETLESKINKM